MTTSPVSRLQWLDIMSDQLRSHLQFLVCILFSPDCPCLSSCTNYVQESGLTKILSAILVIKYLDLFEKWEQVV
jgi:hypothetical protein